MKKLGVVITDGVGFRNFILSDFLAEAEKTFDEVVVLSCLPKTVYNGLVANSKIIELDVFEETFKTWFCRKAKEVAHLQLHKKNNFGIQDNLRVNDSKAKTTRGIATQFIFKMTSLLHSEKWIQKFNFYQQKTFKNNPITIDYKRILEEENFSLLFFTHQRPPFIAPLVYVAEQLKIRTASFIFSWDNLASKGRMAANFDYYMVWSELMKTELQQFYTSVKQENIEVVGTPQFEPYVLDRYKVSNEEFVEKFNLDATLKTVCFSCGDISTSRNDELYIETIANAVQNGQIPNVNFIVRTSPAEDSIRFNDFVSRFPSIKWNYPKWNLSRERHQEIWSQRIPSVEDIKDLRSILTFSDVNINMLSTMSLDFMQFDKPVINVVFGTSENGLYDDQRFLNYAHINKLVESKATKIAKNPQELISALNLYLENSTLDSQNRQQFNALQIGNPLLGTSKRIAETLLRWT
jgi:hypothetical protein